MAARGGVGGLLSLWELVADLRALVEDLLSLSGEPRRGVREGELCGGRKAGGAEVKRERKRKGEKKWFR
jgi:hypothetical protein